MSTVDVMRSIREKEQDADKMRKEALLKAREIIKEVEGAALTDERQNAQLIRSAVGDYQKKQDALADLEIGKIAQGQARLREMERDKAAARIGAASRLIVERILQDGDH